MLLKKGVIYQATTKCVRSIDGGCFHISIQMSNILHPIWTCSHEGLTPHHPLPGPPQTGPGASGGMGGQGVVGGESLTGLLPNWI